VHDVDLCDLAGRDGGSSRSGEDGEVLGLHIGDLCVVDR
jgi:hypothetical protein